MKLQARSLVAVALLSLLAGAHADPRTSLNILAKAVGLDWPTTGDINSLCNANVGVTCDGSDVASIQIAKKDLTGTLPGEIWSDFPKLNYFTASGNKLTGAIPDFAGAEALATLDLSSNALAGPIPASLAKLPALKYVNLRSNPGVCGATGYQKPASLKIDLDATGAKACDGSAAPPIDDTASPSPDATLSPDATASPDATLSPDATASPDAVKSPKAPTASPPSVRVPSPSAPVTYANPECICSLSMTSDSCKTAMTTYCKGSAANVDACTQYTAAVTGTDEDSAAGFSTFLIGRCFPSFKPPVTGYCACGLNPGTVDCSQATLQICAQKVQVKQAGDAKGRPLCLDLIKASLGNSAAVVNVAALLAQNCSSEIQPTKEGAQLTMVLNGVDAQQFQVVYEPAFKQVLADIVGGAPADVQILKLQNLPGAKTNRRLMQSTSAVQVTAFVPGNPDVLIPKLTTSLTSGDFVQRMQAQQITVQPLPNTVDLTAFRADTSAPPVAARAPKAKKKSSKIPIYAGVGAGIVILALCAILAAIVLVKRRRNRRYEQPLPMAKTWLEPNTEDLKPTPSAPMPPPNGTPLSGRSPSYSVPPKPATNHLGAYDATPVPLSVRTTNPPDAPEVVVASDSPKASTTSARNRFWRQGSATSEPATAPLAPQPTSSLTNPTSRFSSLPPVSSAHAAAAAAVAAEASAAGGSATSKQAQQAERRKFWQQFELSWQANKTKPPAITTNAPKVEDDDDIPSSGTSWTSDHTTTPTGRAPQRSTYQNPFVNPKK